MRSPARLLHLHAAVVGIGWFVVGMPLAIAMVSSAAVARAVDSALPAAATGAIVVVAVVVAFPLLWPVWLAVGWHEADLASRVGDGDLAAVARARRVVLAQAIGWAVVAAGCLIVVQLLSRRGGWAGATDLRLAFTGPLIVAALHWETARRLEEPSPR